MLSPTLYYDSHSEILCALLDADADVNALTSDSLQTPLHKASLRGHLDCARQLLKRGALVNCTSRPHIFLFYIDNDPY